MPKPVPNSPPAESNALPAPVFHDAQHHIKIFQGDCLEILPKIPEGCVDLIFADPPYFLSNDGITCHAGRMVSVNKGAWDRSPGPAEMHAFNTTWLAAAQRVLQPNGTIWVSGTSHVIHSIGFAMQELGFKLLNDISWVKPNPPPNLSCRYFTHATETILWAAKNKKSKHTFHYKEMKLINGGKQMKSVWEIFPPSRDEKRFGKHPTQKPIALLERILLASSNEGDLVLDPFCGSGTTILAALRLHRSACGIEISGEYLRIALSRIGTQLVFAQVSAFSFHISLDPSKRSVDRSDIAMESPPQTTLIHRERKFFFVGTVRREVVFVVAAESIDEAWKGFRESKESQTSVFSVIKTETEIYLATGT